MSSLDKISPIYVGTFINEIKRLNIVGIDIFANSTNTPFIRKHGRFILFSGMLLFMFVGQILYIVKKKEIGADFLDVVNAIPSILVVLQDMVKLILMAIKRNEVKELILEIGKLWKFDYDNAEKNEEMYIWIRRLKFWNNVMFGVMTVAMTFFAAVPLIVTIYGRFSEPKGEYKLLLEMYFFRNIDSCSMYIIAAAFQVPICSLCQLCIYTPCDYLLLDLSFSLAALFKLVQIDLLNLRGTDSEDFHNEDNCEDIKNIVKTHQTLLSLAERLKTCFIEMIFSQVYLSSVIICCYLFTALFQMSEFGIAPILGDLMASMGVLIEIFILAVPGQIIADTSYGIAYAAFQSPWYERSYNFRKYISIVMVRAQKPFYLSALGFSNLTLVMFSKVVSTTWSYLSLLNRMNTKLDV